MENQKNIYSSPEIEICKFSFCELMSNELIHPSIEEETATGGVDVDW